MRLCVRGLMQSDHLVKLYIKASNVCYHMARKLCVVVVVVVEEFVLVLVLVMVLVLELILVLV